MEPYIFMEEAVKLARHNVIENSSSPFGAVVVKNGRIIGVGRNEVSSRNDPTAHAEVMAIRDACYHLKDYRLTNCDLYTSCEPCPMCLGAIYWARPRAVYFASTKEDAAKIGFNDPYIYHEFETPNEQRSLHMQQILIAGHDIPFRLWERLKGKKYY